MTVQIHAKPRAVTGGNFNYSNIESPYSLNTLHFTKNGKPFLPIAGEFHFSRCSCADWKRELLKMRDCGINVVSTYVFWNYHEEKKGVFEFSGDNDIAQFLRICKEINMPCILRIGPWCHGEVIRGGFPARIHNMLSKRNNSPKYLKEVEDFWIGLYREVKPFLDGETVFGIQLENEYTGKTEHLITLRRIAEKIGFATPFFTMTAWPSNCPDPEFLPMVGGYPDAPWTMGKKELTPNNRFAIIGSRTEAEIGEDLHKSEKAEKGAFDDIPYACCETGPGNQVTQHRRPYISQKDGYGVGFAKFASGANLLGYYMFHGGRNPNHRMLQENRLTLYPNNYQIIDYDFQSPLSRYGECRPHGDSLRLMHLFVQEFEPTVCTKQAFFPKWTAKDPTDTSFLKCSVRMDEKMSGYFFVSNYEKGLKCKDFKDATVNVTLADKSLTLPPIDVKADSMFFYPFNLEIDHVMFDYILAQPIAKLEEKDRITCYFVECEGVAPRLSVGNETTSLSLNEVGFSCHGKSKNIEIIVLSAKRAQELHIINNKAVFAKGTVYANDSTVFCESTNGFLQDQKVAPVDVAQYITLNECNSTRLPYNYFLYSNGKRKYFSLKIDTSLLKKYFDIRLEFSFNGLNLQVFSDGKLVNDYFNIDGNFVMNLREYFSHLENNNELIIKTVPKTKFGVSNVYNEIPLPFGKTDLKLKKADVVVVLQETITPYSTSEE